MLKYSKKFKELLNIKENPSKYELELFKKTKNYMKFISWIPGLKFVWICNSLSMYATKEKWSDIDLFIITAPNRLWLVRVLITFIFQILWVRRYGNKINERFCLSFFVTENAMDLSKFAIENDIYLFYWIYYLKPILNKNWVYEKFIETNNTLWITYNALQKCESAKVWKCGNNFFNSFWNILDSFFKTIFLPKSLAHKKRLWDPIGIIISDDILKFHDNDKRIKIRATLLNH